MSVYVGMTVFGIVHNFKGDNVNGADHEVSYIIPQRMAVHIVPLRILTTLGEGQRCTEKLQPFVETVKAVLDTGPKTVDAFPSSH